MLKIKAAFKALRNRGVISILLLIQFTYGLSTLTSFGSILNNFYYLNNNSLLELDNTYLVVPGSNYSMIETQKHNYDKEQIEGIYRKLDDNKDVLQYGTYYQETLVLDEKKGPLDSRLVKEMTKPNSGLDVPYIDSIVIDENYYNMLDLKWDKGHGLSKEDFNKNSNQQVNILVGDYFKKYFKIGDLINNQYQINGFLPNKYIVNNNTSNVYLNLDKMVLVPMPDDRYNEFDFMYSRLFHGTLLKLREDANLERLTQMIQLPESDIDLSLKSLKEEVHTNIRDTFYALTPLLIVGLLFILFAVIGIAVTTIVSLMIRKREVGIRLALGESHLGIMSQILIENSIIGISGTVLSIAYFSWKFRKVLQQSSEHDIASVLNLEFNGAFFLLNIMTLMTILIISGMIVYLFIKKQEPKSLIGGME